MNVRRLKSFEFSFGNIDQIGNVEFTVANISCAKKWNSFIGILDVFTDKLVRLNNVTGKFFERFAWKAVRKLISFGQIRIRQMKCRIKSNTCIAPLDGKARWLAFNSGA